jgi:branched-chain amino acid transport system substrate-binding protein
MRKGGVLALAALSAAVIAACGSNSASTSGSAGGTGGSTRASSSASPFTVLFIGDLTGPTKAYGTVELMGMKGADAYIDAHGGMDGHPIKIVALSDDGNPATGVSNLLQYLSSHPKPNEVWPGSEGNEVTAILPSVARNKLLSFSVNDGPNLFLSDASTKYPTSFETQPPLDLPNRSAAAYFKSLGIKKVGILQENAAVGTADTPNMVAALKAAGIPYTIATFPPGAVDLTPEISQLKSSGADAGYFEGFGPAVGYALQARTKVGWNGPFVTDLAASGVDLTTLVGPADLKGVKLMAFRSEGPMTTGIKTLLAQMKPFGSPGSTPINVAALAWDSQFVIANAAKQAGAIDATSLSNALEHLKMASDPMYTNYAKIAYTPNEHENLLGSPSDYLLINPGPVKDGRVTSSS